MTQSARCSRTLSLSLLILAMAASNPCTLKAQTKLAAMSSAVTPKAEPIENFTNEAAGAEQVHIAVGHSQLIKTKLRVSRVYIANPQILDSFTADPHKVVITAKQAGISTIMIEDESSILQFYTVQADTDAGSVNTGLHQMFPLEPIKAEGDQGRIVLSGTVSSAAVADAAGKLASLYAKDISNTIVVNSSSMKQVELKVRVVEVDRTKLEQFGFNFFSGGGRNLATTSTTQFPSTISTTGSTVTIANPLNFSYYNTKLNIGATLQDLATKSILQILAEPTITTVSGQKANFLSGGEFPFPVVQGSSGGTTSITIQFKSYGVKVEFLPIVNPDGTIDLKVSPEVSALDFTNAVTISGYTIPAIATRRADTQVVLNSGQSFAISGLLDNRATDALSRTPGIASIPILGELFKSKNINHSRTELIVIVTPTVVNPLTAAEEVVTPIPAVTNIDSHAFDKTLSSKKTAKPDEQK